MSSGLHPSEAKLEHMIYEARDVTPELCSQYRQNEAICHQLSNGGHGAGALLAMHESTAV